MGLLVRPLGYVAFGAALLMLWVAARLLGERHELGFFADRLHRTLSDYPEVRRREAQAGWFLWGLLFGIAVSPIDPILSRWDEVVLLVLALILTLRQLVVARRAGR